MIKDLDIPLVFIPGKGRFSWYGGAPPRPYDDVRLRVDNNWPAESFEEWLGVVEASVRDHWIGRILEGARIDMHSKSWWEFNSELLWLYSQEKKNRGDGASGMALGPAEWTILAAISAPQVPGVARNLSAALRLSDVDASELLARVRISALELAKLEMPGALASMTSGQKTLPFPDDDA